MELQVVHPHYNRIAIKNQEDDYDDLMDDQFDMCLVIYTLNGHRARKRPGCDTSYTGYCQHGGCRDIVTAGNLYKITTGWLIPASTPLEMSNYFDKIFEKDVMNNYYPHMYDSSVTMIGNYKVTDDIIISNMLHTVTGSFSTTNMTRRDDCKYVRDDDLCDPAKNSFIVDMTPRNYFPKYKFPFDNCYNFYDD